MVIYTFVVDGFPTGSYESEFQIGEKTGNYFGQKYGLYLIIGNTVLWLLLSIFGKLLGTGKYKKSKT